MLKLNIVSAGLEIRQESLSEAYISRLPTLAIIKSKERESKNVSRQTYSFLEVKLDQATGNTSEGNRSRTNKISDKDLPSVLANSSNQSRAQRTI